MVKVDRGSGVAPDEEGRTMGSAGEGIGSETESSPIDPRIQSEIGKHLRAIYDGVINEAVPAKFLELLEKLEQSTTRKN